MNSATPSNETDKNHSETKTTVSMPATETQMTEEELMFYFHLSKYEDVKEKPTALSDEEAFDLWTETNKAHIRYSSSAKQEWKNHIFMYNFFQRRGSQNRASRYLQKIESSKSEKIRAKVSKIRKLNLDYVSLPVERINPDDVKRRRTLERKAKAESSADKLNAERILKSIIFGRI
ncbi:Protein CBG06211 [Caenorhabditis briggsae]|uniref:Protein CBG06211 n=2 Tax=Caenorhabditis briggsae TaxID=6238 RepID=A8X0N0_CAEBR|nr:Protein CBG06211 [Caenorhabditis briggsae]ULT95635.1 hypothetical protein L3Y34_004380 [Caenorhabditis briggsae]CAP26190.1 Protein CBG06211 [Caenorhabditis briggsae]